VDAWTTGGGRTTEQVDHRLLGRGDPQVGAGSPVTAGAGDEGAAREACAARGSGYR